MRIRLIYMFITLAILSTVSVEAQRRKIDSLLSLIPQRKDTALVRLYLKLSSAYRRISLDTSINYAAKALEGAKKYDHKRYQYDGVFKLGEMYREKGAFEVSLDYLRQSVELGRSLGDSLGVAQTYNSVGNTYQKKGDYPKALSYLITSLRMKEALGDRKGISNSLINISNVYDRMGIFSKTEEYLLKGIEIKKELKDYYGVAAASNNLSIVYNRRQQPDKSIKLLEQVLEENKTRMDPYLLSAVMGNLAEAYEYKGDFKKALPPALKCLKLRIEIGDSVETCYAYNTVANIYFDAKNYEQCILHGSKGLAMAKRLELLNQRWDANLVLGRVYESMGKKDLAIDCYKEVLKLVDTLVNSKSLDAIHEMEARYESDRKESEILKLNSARKITELELEKKEANISRQRWIMIFGGVLLLCVVGIAVLALRGYRAKKRANEEIQRAYTIIEEKQKEILDSIYYARRIQNSLLASDKYIDKSLTRLRGQKQNKA